MTSAERMAILERLERGEISPAEAERLLTNAGSPPPATRMGVLEQVESGQLTADEAAQLLLGRRLAAGSSTRDEWHREDEAEEQVTFTPMRSSGTGWKFFLGAGLSLTIVSIAWMNSIFQNSGVNLWFLCAWLPLTAGIVLMALAWAARNGNWMQLKVRSNNRRGGKVFVNMPLPMNIVERFLKSDKTRMVINNYESRGGDTHTDTEA